MYSVQFFQKSVQRYNNFLDFANSILHFLQKKLIFGRKSISTGKKKAVILHRISEIDDWTIDEGRLIDEFLIIDECPLSIVNKFNRK